MKTSKIGVELVHHTKSDVWYQYVHQCTFSDRFTAHEFQLTRLAITKKETEIVFEKLKLEEYMRHEDIIYYACPVVRKVKSTTYEYLKHLKKVGQP